MTSDGTVDTGHTTAGRVAAWFAGIVAGLTGAFFAVAGGWAMADPEGFYERFAEFPPYNAHFIQDIGAFMIGLGAVLLFSTAPRPDGRVVALAGAAVGSAAHTISHVAGYDLGGQPETDIPVWIGITVLLLLGATSRWRQLQDAAGIEEEPFEGW